MHLPEHKLGVFRNGVLKVEEDGLHAIHAKSKHVVLVSADKISDRDWAVHTWPILRKDHQVVKH